MWCPECLQTQLELILINFKDGVAADKVICKKCGYTFTTVWRLKARQEYLNTYSVSKESGD
jgi:C4-type Zn-finger protein